MTTASDIVVALFGSKKAKKAAQQKTPAAATPSVEPEIEVFDEKSEEAHRGRMLRLITTQAIASLVLAGGLILTVPFVQPTYRYYAMTPQHKIQPLVSLAMPNMTNRAILSWATTAITEIMTFGFADYSPHLLKQKWRFTPEGWNSFALAFIELKIGETFVQNQLVLTTVPSDTAVITRQGETTDRVYEWDVQMPVILTYATNNNVTRRERSVIQLTITRVSPLKNPTGVAIKTWSVAH